MRKPKKQPVVKVPKIRRHRGLGRIRGLRTGAAHPSHHPHRGGPGALGTAGGAQRSGSTGAVKPKKRQWSPGWDVACCSAEAVGTLLGLSDAEVLDLYQLTADKDGATIGATIAAADLSRCRGGIILGVTMPEPHAIAVTPDGTWWSWGEPFNPDDWPELVIEEAHQLCGG